MLCATVPELAKGVALRNSFFAAAPSNIDDVKIRIVNPDTVSFNEATIYLPYLSMSTGVDSSYRFDMHACLT